MEKERNIKILIISILFMLIAGLTVAFAALSTTLNINGTAYLDAAKWGIKFEDLSEPAAWGTASIIGTATTTGTAKIEEAKSAEISNINVNLSTPGDKVVYTVDLVNEGTINAKIDKIEKTELTEEQQKYLTFKVTDKEGKEVSEGDILSAGETRNLTITIEFIKDLTKEDLPTSTSTISLSYKLNFVQTDDKTTTTNNTSQQACTTFDKKDTYNVGDVIALCNTVTNKSEDFYVIKDNGDTVEALAKYNLLAGNMLLLDFENENMTESPLSESEEGYGLQNSIAGHVEFDSETGMPTANVIKGIVTFATPDPDKRLPDYSCSECYYGYWSDTSGNLLSKYGTSYPAYVFDSNSNLYTPLENYKVYLKKIGIKDVNVGLLTYEQAVNLGCNNKEHSCESAPSWLYSTNYFTGIALYGQSILKIYTDASFDSNEWFRSDSLMGLRPVIKIKKSEI